MTSSPSLVTMIHVRIMQPGWHCWPDAPAHRAYLRDSHRHIFHYEVAMIVHHDERDVEFHDLMDQVQHLLPEDGQYGPASCETIARGIYGELASKYPERQLSVTVSEDGEAGATVMETS